MLPSIRPADLTDANAIAELIREVSGRSFLREFSETGQLRFLSDHSPESMTARLQSGEFQYDLAEIAGVLVGVVDGAREEDCSRLGIRGVIVAGLGSKRLRRRDQERHESGKGEYESARHWHGFLIGRVPCGIESIAATSTDR